MIVPYDKSNEIGASSLQRTNSNSSLTANVDENFELDQVMTLEECDSTINNNDIGKYLIKRQMILIIIKL